MCYFEQCVGSFVVVGYSNYDMKHEHSFVDTDKGKVFDVNLSDLQVKRTIQTQHCTTTTNYLFYYCKKVQS